MLFRSAFIDHGFNAIDTADVYSAWASGNKGGESETIIGKWLKGRAGMRDKVTIFTKVGSDLGVPGKKGLSEKWILQAVDESLTRLGVGEKTSIFPTGLIHRPLMRRPLALMTSCLRPARCAQLALRTTTSNNLPQR